jgi:hypothetical protein
VRQLKLLAIYAITERSHATKFQFMNKNKSAAVFCLVLDRCHCCYCMLHLCSLSAVAREVSGIGMPTLFSTVPHLTKFGLHRYAARSQCPAVLFVVISTVDLELDHLVLVLRL